MNKEPVLYQAKWKGQTDRMWININKDHYDKLRSDPGGYGADSEWRALVLQDDTPIDMVLHCPKCHMQHIDLPEHWGGKVEPHRSHLCVPAAGGCGHIWRPADVATNGVAAVKTEGRHDSPK